MSDLIYRQAAIDAIEEYFNGLPIAVHYDMIAIIHNLPPAQPAYTDEQIQKMQDLHQAEIEKTFELGREDAKPKWIPVLERCPDKAEMYLITNYDGYVFLHYYDGEDSSKKFWKSYIKAWMPLPEPYREEGENNE